MRALLLLLLSTTAMADYTESRELVQETDGDTTLNIDAGAGTLNVSGSNSVDVILVEAVIVVDGVSDKKARKLVEERVRLEMVRSGDTVRLVSDIDDGGWSWNQQLRIDLEIQIPDSMNLVVDDGSGSIVVRDVLGDVAIDDGSGSVDIFNVGSLYLDDGSGSIDVRGVRGDVEVDDGSGGLDISDVGGSVRIDDGSGSIDVRSVVADLIIISDGSGGVNYSDIGGVVELDD